MITYQAYKNLLVSFKSAFKLIHTYTEKTHMHGHAIVAVYQKTTTFSMSEIQVMGASELSNCLFE